MVHLQTYLEAWSEAQWEFSLAFKDLKDEDVWKRPHSSLLSIGELAGHVSLYEAWASVGAWGVEEDVDLPIKSPLVDLRFAYYTSNIGEPVVLEMGAEELAAEVKRIFEESKAAIMAMNPQETDMLPYNEKVSWLMFMRYRVFHVAYHTGQAYSVRHLLGDTPEDN